MSRRRILIFSTTFFPDPAVGGVRPTQWCRHLPANGWTPIVACRHYGYAAARHVMDANVHPDVEVRYLNMPVVPDASQEQRLRRFASLRARVAWSPFTRLVVLSSVPNWSIRFWRAARDQADALMREVRPDVILTTSPSHATHDLGLWLTGRTGIPWVADFRDPYLMDRHRISPNSIPLVSVRHRRFEADVYRRAKLIVHAIPLHARWARRRYPEARGRIVTLPNGCPPELANGDVEPVRGTIGRRSVRIVGLCAEREAAHIAEAVARLARTGTELELRIVGPLPANVQQLERALGDRLVLGGPRSHTEALREIAGADVLICTLSRARSRYLGLSSKLYEYLPTGKPIIILNPTIPDIQLTERLLGVQRLNEPQPGELSRSISLALAQDLGELAAQAKAFGDRYRRDTQTTALAAWLDALVPA
jgi:glycosyltransferase involved in cell wall biosynthesis